MFVRSIRRLFVLTCLTFVALLLSGGNCQAAAPRPAPGPAPTAPGDEYWAAGFNLPGMNESVRALAVNGADGVLYAGGIFSTAGAVSANYIAKWDGAAWSPLDSGMNACCVEALVVDSGQPVCGG